MSTDFSTISYMSAHPATRCQRGRQVYWSTGQKVVILPAPGLFQHHGLYPGARALRSKAHPALPRYSIT